jgi:hypothetical protein
MLPIKLVINNNKIATAKSETSFLNSKYRGNNYFENLYNKVLTDTAQIGTQIVWGFTPAVKVWKNKLNFDVVSSNISHVEIVLSKYPTNIQIKKFSKGKISYWPKLIIYTLLRKFEKKTDYQNNQSDLYVQSDFPEFNLINSFQVELARKYSLDVYLDMNAEYVNWRIINNPRLNYKTLFFYRDKKLLGYIIYNIKDSRLSVADISFLYEETGREILYYLLNLESQKINTIFYFGNDDSEFSKILFKLFSDFKANIFKSDWANTVIKDISKDKAFVSHLDTSKWFINGLWTEGYSV